jgi:alpha-tubulin suppressor-like RCC1 family protein
MRNRKIVLAVLLSLASASSLILSAASATPLLDDPSIDHSATALNISQWSVAPMVAAGASHWVGLKSDGTVVAVGGNSRGQCDVGDWTDIIQVSAGDYYTMGLRSDGTVVAAGHTPNFDRWTDIVQIAAGSNHVVGLKSDGTVVAKGNCGSLGKCNVRDWIDITQVAAGGSHTVGLKVDGTVVAVGGNYYGQCNVSHWTDIVQVAASHSGTTVGLRPDGTVVAVGNNEDGQCDVIGWTDIVQISTYGSYPVGLKRDGTVITAPLVSQLADDPNWNHIIQVSGGWNRVIGLKSDGTAITTKSDFRVDGWNLGIMTEHALTISSTIGGAVIVPGEESFNYTAGAMIHLAAEPIAGYHFVNWTGDVSTIFNVDAATTIITMSDNHSITANFEKNPPVWPIWLLIVEIIAVGVLAIFFFHERRATRTPYRW